MRLLARREPGSPGARHRSELVERHRRVHGVELRRGHEGRPAARRVRQLRDADRARRDRHGRTSARPRSSRPSGCTRSTSSPWGTTRRSRAPSGWPTSGTRTSTCSSRPTSAAVGRPAPGRTTPTWTRTATASTTPMRSTTAPTRARPPTSRTTGTATTSPTSTTPTTTTTACRTPPTPSRSTRRTGWGARCPLTYTFDGAAQAGGLLDLGFTGLITNGVDDYRSLYDPQKLTAGGAPGVLTVDQLSPGGTTDNHQEYGFQFGVRAGTTGPFMAHTRVVSPFAGTTPTGTQSIGLVLGTGTQNDYVKVELVANNGSPGVRAVREIGGVLTTSPVTPLALPGPDAVELYLEVDPATSHRATGDTDRHERGGRATSDDRRRARRAGVLAGRARRRGGRSSSAPPPPERRSRERGTCWRPYPWGPPRAVDPTPPSSWPGTRPRSATTSTTPPGAGQTRTVTTGRRHLAHVRDQGVERQLPRRTPTCSKGAAIADRIHRQVPEGAERDHRHHFRGARRHLPDGQRRSREEAGWCGSS